MGIHQWSEWHVDKRDLEKMSTRELKDNLNFAKNHNLPLYVVEAIEDCLNSTQSTGV